MGTENLRKSPGKDSENAQPRSSFPSSTSFPLPFFPQKYSGSLVIIKLVQYRIYGIWLDFPPSLSVLSFTCQEKLSRITLLYTVAFLGGRGMREVGAMAHTCNTNSLSKSQVFNATLGYTESWSQSELQPGGGGGARL